MHNYTDKLTLTRQFWIEFVIKKKWYFEISIKNEHVNKIIKMDKKKIVTLILFNREEKEELTPKDSDSFLYINTRIYNMNIYRIYIYI